MATFYDVKAESKNKHLHMQKLTMSTSYLSDPNAHSIIKVINKILS